MEPGAMDIYATGTKDPVFPSQRIALVLKARNAARYRQIISFVSRQMSLVKGYKSKHFRVCQ
jgi:hypothetical protein